MVARIKERMLYGLLEKELIPLLLSKERFYAVKLEQDEEPSGWGLPDEMIDLRMRLTVNESEERIMEWVDYRPMNWMTLSHTAIEEIRRRLTDWWRRPLQSRLYLFRLRLGDFERKHFGRAFKAKGLP